MLPPSRSSYTKAAAQMRRSKFAAACLSFFAIPNKRLKQIDSPVEFAAFPYHASAITEMNRERSER